MTSREDGSTEILPYAEGVSRAARLSGFSTFFVMHSFRQGKAIMGHLKKFEPVPEPKPKPKFQPNPKGATA